MVEMMRILSVHNYPGDYATGGEGNVFEDEAKLFKRHGHIVRQYKCTNANAMSGSLLTKAKAFLQAPWSKDGYKIIKDEINRFAPDIMHVHNFFFVLSPSIFRAAKDLGIPTVATLHNYRLISPCSQLLRNGKICEVCINKNPWRIMLYRCYQNTFLANFLRYRFYYLGERKHQWINDIDAFIALTEFAKCKFIEGGLPKDKIYVKPNFLHESAENFKTQQNGYGAVFVGRISQEKGLITLLKAWQGIKYPLTVIGDGPQMNALQGLKSENVQFVGMKPHDVVMQEIKKAAFLIFPSEWYEGFGLVIIEAMASGRAILASDIGPRSELVKHKENGLLFRAGDANDLRENVRWLIANPKKCAEMGQVGRKEYLLKYTSETNYKMLLNIYEKTIYRY